MNKQLVTPAAFSVSLEVSDEIWEVAKRRHLENRSSDSILTFFNKDISEYLESLLPNSDNNKVACISWAYTSDTRFKLLQKKAEYFK